MTGSAGFIGTSPLAPRDYSITLHPWLFPYKEKNRDFKPSLHVRMGGKQPLKWPLKRTPDLTFFTTHRILIVSVYIEISDIAWLFVVMACSERISPGKVLAGTDRDRLP